MTPVRVGDAPRPGDLVAVEQQAREQLEILHLSPAGLEAPRAQDALAPAQRRAHHEVAPQQRAEPGFATNPPRISRRHEKPLGGVGEREARLAGRVDDFRGAAHGRRPRVGVREPERHLDVLGEKPVVGMEQRHEIGLGGVEPPVPVRHHAEVRFVCAVHDAGVGEARHQIAGGVAVLPPVVEHETTPAGLTLGEHALDRLAQKAEAVVIRDGERDARRLHQRGLRSAV